MQYRKGLIQKELPRLKRRRWYRQRFDGSPNLIYMIGEMELKPERRKFEGGEERSHIVIFSNDRTDWYIDEADIKRIAGIFIKKSYRESNIGKRTMKKWGSNKSQFIAVYKRIDQRIFRQLTTKELQRRLVESYFGWVTMSSLIDGLGLGTDRFVDQELAKALAGSPHADRRGEIFATLTAPVKISFINESELSLLQVARAISKRPLLRRRFLQHPPKVALDALGRSPSVYRMLVNHQRRYFWTRNNYVHNHVLSLEYFAREVQHLLRSGDDVVAQIRNIKQTPQRNQQEKAALVKQLRLPKHLRNLIEISETFSYWQDERKQYSFIATHYFSIILKEIGRRFGYSLMEMKYLLVPEVLSLLAGSGYTISKRAAAQRRKLCFMYDNGPYYEIVSGPAARKLQAIVFSSKVKKSISSVSGLSASSGRAKGKVKVITSVKEIGRVKQGDILVAIMTRPDYISGMKKATAIVTDEGSVTCHAAIIARELGIPCIIATRIATQVFKDGDRVEVDATRGVVKRL